MMNVKGKIALLFGLTVGSAIAAASAAFAWFASEVTIPNGNYTITGNSAGAYFAYGDGSESKPYGISTARHLYNLAWLQYNGTFNQDADGNHVIDKQYYFELAKDIDCDGWTIPPIGTDDNPFVGEFNGQGYIISNLTTANTASFSKKPNNVNYNERPEIVGLFGVVGQIDDENYSYSYTYDSSINEIKNVGLSNITVETSTSNVLVGILAGYVNGTIDNVAVNDSSIDVQTDSTACLESDWTNNLSDYGTVGYATSSYRKSIKKIEQDLYDVSVTPDDTHQIEYNASDDGDSEGWGGSINMKTIYNRIVSLRRNKSTDVSSNGNSTARWKLSSTYYDDVRDEGNITYSNDISTTTINNRSYRDAYSRYNGYNESGHEYLGSYNVYARAVNYNTGQASEGYGDGYNSTYGDQMFLYLCGGHYENRTYKDSIAHYGRYITDGTNYLCFDGTNLYNTTNASEATLWTFTASSNYYYISVTYNGNDYFLRYNSGSLGTPTTGTDSNKRWVIDDSGSKRDIKYNGDNNYHLTYENGDWTLHNASGTAYYLIYDDQGRYLKPRNESSGAHVLVSTTASDSHWLYNSTNKYFYYRYNNSDRKLGYYDSQYMVQAWTDTTSGGYFKLSTGTTTGTGKLTCSNGYYVRYNTSYNPNSSVDTSNQPWAASNNSASGATFTIEYVDPSIFTSTLEKSVDLDTPHYGPDYETNASKGTANSKMYYTAQDTTYLPLNVNSDTQSYISGSSAINSQISSGNLDPKDSNTGYLIAGSNNRGVLQTNSSFSSQDSNIRISRYEIANVNSSYNKSVNASTTINDLPNSSIYTYKINSDTNPNSGITRDTMNNVYSESKFPRYNDSKTSFFQNSLATSTDGQNYTTNRYVYGLHFMASTISTSSIVNASKVSVLGNKCDTYQFPVDCIDFNLKQKGNVNFFAGTYFDKNNSFFSLHEIFRNDDAVLKENGEENEYTSYNTISQIKEIEEIWSTDVGSKTTKYANIYKYKGATGNDMYSVPYRIGYDESNKSAKFKMNKSSTTESSELYTYVTMNSTDFEAYRTTYGYKLRFMTSQIGKQNSTYNTNAIYYFEFPMNAGEYCLGSVTGGTGAYLLYLDIGANAAKTQRTVFYEHFKEIKKVFDYPQGVAIVAVSVVDDNYDAKTSLDERNTANMLIKTGSKGKLTISRTNNDVTITRTGTGFTNAAKPTLVGDLMWDNTRHEYNIHDPNDNNLTDEITSTNTTTDTTRAMYLDYNVNLDELTKTIITDTALYNPASGMNVNGTTYYADRGYMAVATIYDLPTDSISVSSYYVSNGSGGYVKASGNNVHGTHYYTTSAGTTEVTVGSLTTDSVSVNGLFTSTDSIIQSAAGKNVKGVHYYSDNACTTEVKLADLASGLVSVTSYYVSNGDNTYVAATGSNVNGTHYYLDLAGKHEVTLADIANDTVSVESYYTKEETGRNITQYYQNGTYSSDFEVMKIYDPDNSGAKYTEEQLKNTSVVTTYDTTTGVNGTCLVSFEYKLEDRVGIFYDWILEYSANGNNHLGTYYKFDGYTFNVTVNNDGTVTFMLLSKDYDTENVTITFKDIVSTNTVNLSGVAVGNTITVPITA